MADGFYRCRTVEANVPDRVPFGSILFEVPEDAARAERSQPPGCFTDLNLDQLVGGVTAGRGEYQLQQFFYLPLRTVSAVGYRHEVMRDLESQPVRAAVQAFAAQLRVMRDQLTQAGKLHYRYQQERWFLDAVHTYCEAVAALAGQLSGLDLGSRGCQGLRDYLAGYTSSAAFRTLAAATATLYRHLDGVRYCVHIKGNRVRVSQYDGEPDYSAEVEQTFAKFRQGAVQDYRVGFPAGPDMNHVEARVLDLVAELYPDVFGELSGYAAGNRGYLDATVARFDREVQFYLGYLEFTEPLKRRSLEFCYPTVSAEPAEVSVLGSFDLALAGQLARAGSAPVSNDFSLRGAERILVLTGPNQGGKTTFARMVGQVHYLASLGLPVPGRMARLSLPDEVFTHFEREEDITTLRGKLADELTRIHQILQQATSRSVLVMNESFTSTTLQDALLLGTEVMRRVTSLGLVCVYVTFVDELASLSEATVSMVATIDPDNPAGRTYQIIRRPADGLAYAAAIAAKYGLTYQRVTERITS